MIWLCQDLSPQLSISEHEKITYTVGWTCIPLVMSRYKLFHTVPNALCMERTTGVYQKNMSVCQFMNTKVKQAYESSLVDLEVRLWQQSHSAQLLCFCIAEEGGCITLKVHIKMMVSVPHGPKLNAPPVISNIIDYI